MTVLKKGSETNWGKELQCVGTGMGETAGCGALLLVSPRDVKSVTSRDYSGDSDTSHHFVCPECGARTYVSYKVFYGGRY